MRSALLSGLMRSRIAYHLGIAFVAVFGASQVDAVGGRAFEKGEEVGNAHDIDSGLDAVGEMGERRQYHVPAVRTARDGDALRIELFLTPNPI